MVIMSTSSQKYEKQRVPQQGYRWVLASVSSHIMKHEGADAQWPKDERILATTLYPFKGPLDVGQSWTHLHNPASEHSAS